MADALAKAITKIIYPALKAEGFRRARMRDLIRVENGIVQLLYFQVSGHGGREFCVTACANIVAANEFVSLEPGFRLTRDTDGGDLWLPSHTAEEAERSARVVLGSIQAEALPYFESSRTPAGFANVLSKERWASTHHLSFQRGVAAALQGETPAAIRHLADAIQLYEADGRDWCAGYIQRATALQHAIEAKSAPALLTGWYEANSKAHGIR
jgi:hypothetical protein